MEACLIFDVPSTWLLAHQFQLSVQKMAVKMQKENNSHVHVVVDLIRCAIDSKKKKKKAQPPTGHIIKKKRKGCESLTISKVVGCMDVAVSIIWVERSGPDSLCDLKLDLFDQHFRLGLLFACTCSSKNSVQRWAQRSRIKVFPFLEQTDGGSDDELDILPWQQLYHKDRELHTLVLMYSCCYFLSRLNISYFRTKKKKQ